MGIFCSEKRVRQHRGYRKNLSQGYFSHRSAGKWRDAGECRQDKRAIFTWGVEIAK
jgi:hypothetical protein